MEAAAAEGRRERKKHQTREALLHAALDLFETKGYEHTAIREITDAVDVSERTFFRYYASKEDLMLSLMRDGAAAFRRELAVRPADEAPLAAMCAAFRLSVRETGDRIGDRDGMPVYMAVMKLIDETPALLAAHLRLAHEEESEVVAVLADREGVASDDPRPQLLATIFGALAFTASRHWRTHGGTSDEELLAAFDHYAAQLTPALLGPWTPGG